MSKETIVPKQCFYINMFPKRRANWKRKCHRRRSGHYALHCMTTVRLALNLGKTTGKSTGQNQVHWSGLPLRVQTTNVYCILNSPFSGLLTRHAPRLCRGNIARANTVISNVARSNFRSHGQKKPDARYAKSARVSMVSIPKIKRSTRSPLETLYWLVWKHVCGLFTRRLEPLQQIHVAIHAFGSSTRSMSQHRHLRIRHKIHVSGSLARSISRIHASAPMSVDPSVDPCLRVHPQLNPYLLIHVSASFALDPLQEPRLPDPCLTIRYVPDPCFGILTCRFAKKSACRTLHKIIQNPCFLIHVAASISVYPVKDRASGLSTEHMFFFLRCLSAISCVHHMWCLANTLYIIIELRRNPCCRWNK